MENTGVDKLDVVIPLAPKDGDIFELCLIGCLTHIAGLNKVYVVSADALSVPNGVEVIDENHLFDDGLSIKYVRSILAQRNPSLVGRSGWLYQQFIKMGCSYAIPNLLERYVVVDADVVFLRDITFYEKGRSLLAETTDLNEPYSRCYKRIFGEAVSRKRSYVVHHMPMCKSIMLELLGSIEERFGKRWYDAIIENVDENHDFMFSEYQTYGYYLENHHPEKLAVRRLRNVQRFKACSLLQVLFCHPHYVTIHDYKKPHNNPKTSPYLYEMFVRSIKNNVQTGKSPRLNGNSHRK